ncbi:MAG TPA: hypothetical protein VM657_09085 [Sphingomonas sp.]|nr:hypothetical protein [Sphingomonas sp.]
MRPGTAADILVESLREPTDSLPIIVDRQRFALQTKVSRQANSEARRFARCAKPDNRRLLRAAIDGPVNQRPTQWALDRIIRTHQGCYSGLPVFLPPPAPYYGVCNPQIVQQIAGQPISICRAIYDRAALIDRVLDRYVPHLSLTTTQLLDPVVHARFRAREDERNVSRLSSDLRYFGVAACIVAVQPKRALALRQSEPGSASETRLITVLVGTATTCLGGVKRVKLDAVQFRAYIIDAIYSWAVALKGADSLIPPADGD